ncbi:MAG: anthranilate phosphoribosyltransferase [Pseudomonadota bacterium]
MRLLHCLPSLRVRGETTDEITAGAMSLRSRMMRIEAPDDAVDTCGTGGDAKGTHNISTTVALVVAGCGVPVAKHGNRGLTSQSGSADVLTELGVKIDAPLDRLSSVLNEAGICFMMAPRHHGAMKHVAAPRIELGTRTIFNLLGPLANPAGVKYQVVGVFAPEWVEPLAHVLGRLGAKHAWVVHSRDGLDEISTTASTLVAEWDGRNVRKFEITPEEVGLHRVQLKDIEGGEPAFNAAAIRRTLQGEAGPLRDIVLFGSAAVLLVAGKAASLVEGVTQAAASIDDGAAQSSLDRLIAATNR